VLVCNWPHSVGQNYLYVKVLLTGILLFRSTFRRFCTVCKTENSVPSQPSGRRVFLFGLPAVQSSSRPDDMSYRPNAHQTKASSFWTTWIHVRIFLYVEKLQTTLACIRSDVSAARPDNSQCSTKLQIFFPKVNMGRLLQPSGRRGFPSGRATP